MRLFLGVFLSMVSFQVFAADCKSTVDLTKFLKDPKAFLNAPIVKLDQNCVPGLLSAGRRLNARPTFSAEAIKSGEYVEIKDSYRKKICLTVDDKQICLGDIESGRDIEQGRAPILSLDLPSNLVTGKVIKSLQEMEDKNLKKGKVSVSPWSDWYWPIAVGQLGFRYGSEKTMDIFDSEIEDEETWPALRNYVIKNPPRVNSKMEELSPSEKYDILVGDEEFTLTQAMWASGKNYQQQFGKVEFWMGLCDGWAAASYSLPRPKKAITVMASDGETMLKFYPSDLKALGTLLYAKGSFRARYVGARCNTKKPRTDRNGRIQDQDCFDNNPGSWHMTVVSQIGQAKKPFVMDATYDYEVWNHPVVAYSYSYFNPQKMTEHRTMKHALVDIENFKNDKFKKYRSPQTRSVVGIKMEVKYLIETLPTMDEKDSPRNDDYNYAEYIYDLELNHKGEIIGGEWYNNAHPDFLWTPYYGELAHSVIDDELEGRVTESIVFDEDFQENVIYASEEGQPVGKLIQALFRKASR